MPQNILAVDDEIHMLKLLERIVLEKTHYDIVTTNNALEIPSILEKDTFDLLIVDLKMPGMDGLDILRLIREQQRPEEVVIITAFGTLESALEAFTQGVFGYITKPFKKEHIIATIDRVMRWQELRRDSARMAAVFDREPYPEALKAFEKEYARRLLIRCGEDKKATVERSGLSPEIIDFVSHEQTDIL